MRRVASIPSSTGIADVHQHDVGSQTPGAVDGFLAVGRLADDCQLRLALEDLAQPDADERLIIRDQDRRHRSGSSTLTANPPPAGRLASKRPP